jgi:hypothetical protein
MVPILNHSLFIKINNKITLVIIEIVIEKGLDIKTFLPLRSTDLIKTFFSLKILLFNVEFDSFKIGFTSCSGE